MKNYGNRGVSKPGCNPSEHTIIHLRGTEPSYISGEYEKDMTESSIVIEPNDANEIISPYFRIWLRKTYDIECNVRVRAIGMVVPELPELPEHKARLLLHHQEKRQIGLDSSSYLKYIHPMNKIPIAIQVEVQTGRFDSQIGLRIDPTKPQHVSDTAFEPVQDQSTYFVETEAPLKLPVSLSGYKIINADDWQSIQSLESLTTLVSTSRVATLIDKSATFELQRAFREDVVNWALSLGFEGYLHWASQIAT
jgi:hypothetical protein